MLKPVLLFFFQNSTLFVLALFLPIWVCSLIGRWEWNEIEKEIVFCPSVVTFHLLPKKSHVCLFVSLCLLFSLLAQVMWGLAFCVTLTSAATPTPHPSPAQSNCQDFHSNWNSPSTVCTVGYYTDKNVTGNCVVTPNSRFYCRLPRDLNLGIFLLIKWKDCVGNQLQVKETTLIWQLQDANIKRRYWHNTVVLVLKSIPSSHEM